MTTTYPENGASSAEYGLLIALVAGIIVAALVVFGSFTAVMFTDSCDRMLADGVALGAPSANCH